MAKIDEDGSFELQQKRWTELMNLRQTMTDHRIDPAGIELAISNVFDPKKGSIIDVMIFNAKELMAVILKLTVLRIDSSNAKMTLEKSFIPGMSGQYDADLLRLKGMIKMREGMAQMGIPTGCIEATIAEVFQPLSPAAKAVKPEEMLEVFASMPRLPIAEPVEPVEPVELDASDTAISRRSTAEIGKLADFEVSETAVTQLMSSTGAANLVESPSQPTGCDSQAIQALQETAEVLKPESSDTEGVKRAKTPSQANTTKPASSDAERISNIGTSIEAMDLESSAATTSTPMRRIPSAWTSPSTVDSILTTSSSSNSSPTRLNPSAKRSAPPDTGNALGSAQNPICLRSSPAPKRQRTAKNITPRADPKQKEDWTVGIQSVGILGLNLKPRHEEAHLSIVFDVETRRIVFYNGEQSLTALYPGLEINPDALLSVTRPTYNQLKDLKVRFMWLDTDAVETFLDILVATKKDCRELVAELKKLTSFSEIILPEPRMNKLCKDLTWTVEETHNAVGLSVTKHSVNVWLD